MFVSLESHTMQSLLYQCPLAVNSSALCDVTDEVISPSETTLWLLYLFFYYPLRLLVFSPTSVFLGCCAFTIMS